MSVSFFIFELIRSHSDWLVYIAFARSADTFMLIVEKVKILRHWPLNDDNANAVPHIMSTILFYSIPCQYDTTRHNQTMCVCVCTIYFSFYYCSKAASDLLLFTSFRFFFFILSFVGLMLGILVRENVTQFHKATGQKNIYVCVCLYMA